MSSGKTKPPAPAKDDKAASPKGSERDMGAALRSAYQQTVDEAIPSDLLDLLGKLG